MYDTAQPAEHMELVAKEIGTLRGAVAEVGSLAEITGPFHPAAFTACHTVCLYRLGVNAETVLAVCPFRLGGHAKSYDFQVRKAGHWIWTADFSARCDQIFAYKLHIKRLYSLKITDSKLLKIWDMYNFLRHIFFIFLFHQWVLKSIFLYFSKKYILFVVSLKIFLYLCSKIKSIFNKKCYNCIVMKRFSESYAYPIRPMSHVSLGDYGLFDRDVWRKMGNINNLRGYRCTLHKSTLDYGAQDICIAHEANLEAFTQAEVATDLAEIKCRLSFSKANGYYLHGTLHKQEFYDSIDIEVKRYLEKLDDAEIWKAEYCLVVGVFYASSSFAAFAHQADTSIDFNTNVGDKISPLTIFSNVKLSAAGILRHSEGIEIVDRPDLWPVAFQVVRYSRKFLRWPKSITYAGEENII